MKHPELYDDTDDYKAMYPAKLPLWKGSLFVILFGLLFRYGSQIISFIKTLI